MSRSSDILGIIRGLQLVAEAGIKLQTTELKRVWANSNCRVLVQDCLEVNNATNTVYESADRIATVCHSLKEYVANASVRGSYSQNLSDGKTTVKESEKTEASESQFEIKLTQSDQELLRKLDMEHQEKLKKLQEEKKKAEAEQEKGRMEAAQSSGSQVTAGANHKGKLKLSEHSKQRKVPSSRIGRMISFGGLAAGLGFGTATEYAKRAFGSRETTTADASTLFLNPRNLDLIVDTLCKVRGAALKLGQLLSIQDDSIINPNLAKALERVRKSADFMPNWQVEQVMGTELGQDWRERFIEFEDKPFAAASIGQVHWGKILDGREVAIKIQYPGVARGIESDIDNLGGIMKYFDVFPKGMFLDNLMRVAKRELAWEVDYKREAECTRKFRQLLASYSDYYVPDVIDDLSTNQVFTTELLDGTPVDQCFDMPAEDRRFIAEKIIELCLLELLEFRYMQTDPNWANFLYNPKKKQIMLLDFGASREYSKDFMDQYVKILKAACDADKETVLTVSRDIGFLTGFESKVMEDAHVDAVMILGEVFRSPDAYDFAGQDMTARIQNLVPTMVTHRLCPPPEEISSYEAKLIDIFKSEIEVLENVVRLSLGSGLDLVERHMREMEEKAFEIRNDAINLIEEHSFNTLENLEVYTEAVASSAGNGSQCSEGLERVVSRTQEKRINKLKKSVTFAKIESLVTRSVPIMLKFQNKTFEMREMAKGCVYFQDEECLSEVVEKVANLREVTPSLIQTVVNRLEMQIKIVESELVSEAQKIVNAVVEEHSDILFSFIQCII